MKLPQPDEVYNDGYGGIFRVLYATRVKVVMGVRRKTDPPYIESARMTLKLKHWRMLIEQKRLTRRNS